MDSQSALSLMSVTPIMGAVIITVQTALMAMSVLALKGLKTSHTPR